MIVTYEISVFRIHVDRQQVRSTSLPRNRRELKCCLNVCQKFVNVSRECGPASEKNRNTKMTMSHRYACMVPRKDSSWRYKSKWRTCMFHGRRWLRDRWIMHGRHSPVVSWSVSGTLSTSLCRGAMATIIRQAVDLPWLLRWYLFQAWLFLPFQY